MRNLVAVTGAQTKSFRPLTFTRPQYSLAESLSLVTSVVLMFLKVLYVLVSFTYFSVSLY